MGKQEKANMELDTPFDNAAIACECIVTSVAFASQVIEAQKKLQLQPEENREMVSILLETYAIAWLEADGAAQA
tara:strand:- start:2138 stop:2359 length:222 start_codon:yes stop_codon:yes gene_type:complete